MKLEDIGPIIAIEERRQRREWHQKQKQALRDDMNSPMPSQRAARARRFAHQIMHLLRRHVPEACESEALEELMIHAYGNDIEIVEVPPDRDALAKAALDAAMHGVGITRIVPNEFFVKPESK